MTYPHPWRWFAAVLVLAMCLGACDSAGCTGPAASGPSVEVADAWARPTSSEPPSTPVAVEGDATPPSWGSTAIYLTLRNCGRQADRLIGVESEAALSAEIHQTETQNGVTTMSQVQQVDLLPNRHVTFAVGGMHIMLIRLNRPLLPGDTISLTLKLETSGSLDVQVPVRTP